MSDEAEPVTSEDHAPPDATKRWSDPAPTGPPSKLLGLLGFFAVALLAVGALFGYQKWSTSPPPERAASLGAKLELAAGEVTLLVEGPDADQAERLLSGTPLPLGASIQTGEGARALVRLSDGSRVFLNESTIVDLGEDTGITVNAGQVWLETQPLDKNREPLVHTVGPASFALTDGGASLTVTDTGALIYIGDGVGSVTSAGGFKEVHTGEQATVSADQSPIIEPVAFWDDWTGGMAGRRGGGQLGAGSGSLYAVDRSAPPGTPALQLRISSQTVDIAIEHGLAETRVDQRFFNGADHDVEGWYWFTIPEGATLVGFELETNGKLIAGEIVEKKQAVAAYEAAVRSDDNPALLEWIDERTVRARIYPVPSLGERRIVVRYQQLLSENQGKLRYSYPLAGGSSNGRPAPTIEEFSLAVDLRGDIAQDYTISTLGEATVSNDDALVTMRRSGFTPRADFELELTRKPNSEPAAPLRLNEYEAGSDQARFVMLRWIPDLDFAALATPRADVVVVVDTSAFGGDADHQSRIAVAEALLRSLSESDRFALMTADLSAEVLFPAKGLSPATPQAITEALELLRSHRPGGATDLGAIFEHALNRVHDAEQPAVVYVGDGLATSGERGADALAERLRRALTGSRARLFTVGVGPAVEDRLLARLARVGGGESLRVESADQAVVRALELSGALKTPTITDLELELGGGLDDRFDNATGKLARGQELVVLARTHHELPETVTIRGRLGGEAFEREYPLTRTEGALDYVVPKLWASARIERMLGDGRGPDAVRGKVLALGLEYGLMTPFTSFLALESEAAYARQGVERRERPWDFELLGAVLPHTRAIERGDNWGHDLGDEPTPGELLLGALSAPLGCKAPSEQADKHAFKKEEARAASRPDVETAAAAPNPAQVVKTAAPSGAPEPEDTARAEAAPVEEMAPPAAPPTSESKASPGSYEFGGRGGGSGAAAIGGNHRIAKAAGAKRRRARPDPTGGISPKLRDQELTSPVDRHQKLACSDASERSLAQRKILWERRLERAPDMIARLRTYEHAAASCEVKSWRQQRVFLQLLQAEARSETEIQLLLTHFHTETEAKAFLGRALLRRLVDPALIGAVERSMSGWLDTQTIVAEAERATTAEQALALIDESLTKHADASDDQRLPLDLLRIDLLFELRRIDDAVAAARKLRERGLITPLLAQQLGELLVAAGEEDEAKRVFSEIVEYDPNGEFTRRLLGDIFLRHGWAQEAYRQYQDLVSLTGKPSDVIRMAKAAAGAGRTDQALRLLRRVASGEGRPGPDDPRRFARLHAAVLLAVLLATEDSIPKPELERELKRLQLFDSPTTWTFLVWQDLEQTLTLGVEPPSPGTTESDAAKRAALRTRGGQTAGDTGLWSIQTADLDDLIVRHQGPVPNRAVAFERVTVRWDGEHFEVERSLGTIAAKAAREAGEDSDGEDPQDDSE